MQMTGKVDGVEVGYSQKTGKPFWKTTINGETLNVFDASIQEALGKVIEYEVVQNGQWKNFGKVWSYAPEGAALSSPSPSSAPNSTGGVPREDSILRQSSLKAGIEIARLVLEADKLPTAVKKDPALVEEYVKDLSVRLFHWVKAGNWELSDADIVMEEK